MEGGYRCNCPPGFDGDARSQNGCADFNECSRSPCGRDAQCVNTDGSFRCLCPEGRAGDPMESCSDLNECAENPCGENSICTNSLGSFTCTCQPDFIGNPYTGCVDIDECTALQTPCASNAICENAAPGYNCRCLQGFAANPDAKIACDQVDVNTLCLSNFDCTNNAECIDGQCFCQNGFEPQGASCVDIDECRSDLIDCKNHSICINTPGSYRCECEGGYVGTPPRIQCKAPCEDVRCGPHAYCKPDGLEAYCICEDGWTFNPSDIAAGCIDIDECDTAHGPSGRCGLNAQCSNLPGSYSCKCPDGYRGHPETHCLAVDECSKNNRCGQGAVCKNVQDGYECSCPEGTIADPDPSVRCVTVVTCKTDSDCPGNAICDEQHRCLCPEPNVGNDCRRKCHSKIFEAKIEKIYSHFSL